MNYVQNPSYVANGNNEATDRNHQRIPQAQVYIPYPARQPAASGSFYAYGVSYTNSLTMSEHPNEAEALQMSTWNIALNFRPGRMKLRIRTCPLMNGLSSPTGTTEDLNIVR
jgi:hypothetical protein